MGLTGRDDDYISFFKLLVDIFIREVTYDSTFGYVKDFFAFFVTRIYASPFSG